MSQDIIDAVLEAAKNWADSFNAGNAAGCAECYTEEATMVAEPLATVKGRKEIQDFWQSMIDGGYANVEYLDPQVTVVETNVAELSSPWKMNLASGMIHKERWELGTDGRWRLAYDHFEVLEQVDS